MKPDPKFSYIRADEVAECWDGVPQWLHHILWHKIVPKQPPVQNLEDSGPSDHVGHANLAKYWHHLPREAQLLLNSLARRN